MCYFGGWKICSQSQPNRDNDQLEIGNCVIQFYESLKYCIYAKQKIYIQITEVKQDERWYENTQWHSLFPAQVEISLPLLRGGCEWALSMCRGLSEAVSTLHSPIPTLTLCSPLYLNFLSLSFLFTHQEYPNTYIVIIKYY